MTTEHPLVVNLRLIVSHHSFRYLDNLTGEAADPAEVERHSGTELDEEGDDGVVLLHRPGGRVINPIAVDPTSANAWLTVYDNLSPANREKLLGFTVAKSMELAWKIIDKTSRPK